MIFGLAMNAQKIVPLENKKGYKIINRNEEIYFKDVNNVLVKYVGTWKGTYGSKKYELRIVKNTDSYKVMKYDELLVRYIVTDLNGNIIENTTSLPNSSPYVMSGRYYYENRYYLNYVAKGGNCAQSGQINLLVNGGNMNVLFQGEKDLIDSTECPVLINQYFREGAVLKLIKQ